MTRRRDILLILVILTAALLLLAYGFASRGRELPLPSPESAETASDGSAAGYSDFVREEVRKYFEEYPAESYLLLTTRSSTYSPIPLNGENALRIAQPDGSENVNAVGKDRFHMASSNCENQNCVEQGEVTLENRDTRVLFNMVICLPHGLSLELLTRAEAEARLLEIYAQEAAAP